MGYSKESGFWGHWDMYAEQLMLYVLGVASPTFPIDRGMYDAIQKPLADYENIKNIVYTYCGTACVGPKGYSGGFGAMPAIADLEKQNDGTISPSGAAGSIVFTPKLSIQALENYYNNFPKLWCKYGFRDAYNLENSEPWYSKECIGIDKGILMIMIENYFTGLIWKYFMKNEYVKKGLDILDITKKDKEEENDEKRKVIGIIE